jgi:hypothetical protein
MRLYLLEWLGYLDTWMDGDDAMTSLSLVDYVGLASTGPRGGGATGGPSEMTDQDSFHF